MSISAEDRELLIVSYHEAGHAALHVEFELPLHEARVGVKRRLFGGVEGWGYVHAFPGGDGFVNSIGDYILASIAGPEAEARLLHQLNGGSLKTARRQAYAFSRDGDFGAAREYVRDAPFTLRDAEMEAQDWVAKVWPSVEAIAAALRERGRMKAREIRRVAR